jgi:hypothetical protein
VSVTLTPGSSPCRRRPPAEDLAGVFHLPLDQRKGVERGKSPLPRARGACRKTLKKPHRKNPSAIVHQKSHTFGVVADTL